MLLAAGEMRYAVAKSRIRGGKTNACLEIRLGGLILMRPADSLCGLDHRVDRIDADSRRLRVTIFQQRQRKRLVWHRMVLIKST